MVEYRKKHLKPKKDIDVKLREAFENQELMNQRLDVYTSCKKAAFFVQ
jgi:hypothetical protein